MGKTSSNQILLPTSELRFGFLASSVYNNLESDNYQVRLATIKDLVSTVQTTASSQIEIDKFLDYMVKFLDDDNIIIAQKSCAVIESLCYNLYGNIALYKNHLLKIVIPNLGQKKKFLSTFSQNILHMMMKSISPQIILSEVFSMTLLSPSRTLTQLFNFVSNEIENGTVPPHILTKYAFILEDALNSDDRNLVESVQTCLQEIKIRDIYSFETIIQRIKTAYSNSNSFQTPNINNNNNNYNKFSGLKTQTFTNLNLTNSSSSDYRQPFFSANNYHYTKLNRSFISNATFALVDDDKSVSNSKPGSADDSRVPTAKINIENSNDFDVPQVYDDFDTSDQKNQEYPNYRSILKDSGNSNEKQKFSKSMKSSKKRLLKIHTTKG